MATVRASPLPSAASAYRLNGLRLLIGLCAELQRQHGARPFFLGCRDAGRLLDGIPSQRAAKWLRRLVHDGVLRVAVKGNVGNRRATEYYFLWETGVTTGMKVANSFGNPSPRQRGHNER